MGFEVYGLDFEVGVRELGLKANSCTCFSSSGSNRTILQHKVAVMMMMMMMVVVVVVLVVVVVVVVAAAVIF